MNTFFLIGAAFGVGAQLRLHHLKVRTSEFRQAARDGKVDRLTIILIDVAFLCFVAGFIAWFGKAT
jgi:hypothetical protein